MLDDLIFFILDTDRLFSCFICRGPSMIKQEVLQRHDDWNCRRVLSAQHGCHVFHRLQTLNDILCKVNIFIGQWSQNTILTLSQILAQQDCDYSTMHFLGSHSNIVSSVSQQVAASMITLGYSSVKSKLFHSICCLQEDSCERNSQFFSFLPGHVKLALL